MPKISYTGPFDAVEVPALGRDVKNGETVDAPAAVAGRAPTVTKDESGNDVVDLGDGLLAQSDNWQPAPPARRKES